MSAGFPPPLYGPQRPQVKWPGGTGTGTGKASTALWLVKWPARLGGPSVATTPTFSSNPPVTDPDTGESWTRSLLDLTSFDTAVATALSVRRKPTVVQIQDLVIWANGIDNPKVYEYSGGTVYDLGLTAPSAAPSLADQGIGTFAGTYTYAIRWKRSTTGEYSSLSTVATLTADGSSQYIRLTWTDPSITGADKCEIFRSKTGVAAPIYKIATVTIGTELYDDATADSAIDITLVAPWRPAPGETAAVPVFRYIVTWMGRLWAAWVTGNRSRLYWSEPNTPWLIPATNYVDINPQDRDVITGLAVVQDSIIIFKSRHIYALANITFQPGIGGVGERLIPDIKAIDEETGAASQHSIVPFENTLMFISGEGKIYQFPSERGLIAKEKSETLDATLKDLWLKRLEEAEGVYDETHRIVRFAATLGASPANTDLMLYDQTQGGWLRDTIGKEAIASYRDTDGRDRVVWGDVQGNIHQLNVGAGYGARTGTLSGDVASATVNTLTCTGATFDTTGSSGVPVTTILAGVPQETNFIVSATSTVLTLLWRWQTTPTTDYKFVIGGCFPEWKFGYTAFGDGGQRKLLRYMRIEYVPQTSGEIGIYIARDHQSEELEGIIDLSGSGEDEVWMGLGFKRQQTRLKCFEGAVGVELLAVEWAWEPMGRHWTT